MKLLHWHKLANEAALKAALIRTKRLRKKDKRAISTASSQRQQEKVAWMQRIVEEEQMKPLEVTDDFIRQYEERERAEAEVLEKEVQRHISNLNSLKQNLKKREEEKRRYVPRLMLGERRHASSLNSTQLNSTPQLTAPAPDTQPTNARRPSWHSQCLWPA